MIYVKIQSESTSGTFVGLLRLRIIIQISFARQLYMLKQNACSVQRLDIGPPWAF